MRKVLMILVVLCLCGQTIWAKAPIVGDLAAPFSVVSLKGDRLSLKDLRGKIILIGMFHICLPCQMQAMEFKKVRKSLLSDKLVILGINTAGDSKEDVKEYLSGFPTPINFSYYLDPGQTVHKAYIQRDMPTVLIIGADGRLLARSPSVGANQLISYIKKLL